MTSNDKNNDAQQGLVLSAKTVRNENAKPPVVSAQQVEDALLDIPANKNVEKLQPQFSINSSPGSIRVSKRSPLKQGQRVQNYKPRSNIKGWSPKARAFMVLRLATLDYSTMLDDENIPAMVTLTYPGEWKSLVPDAPAAKRHLHAFRKRFERKFGVPLKALWKLEFQRRTSPHFHLFIVLPTSFKEFASWLSVTWVEIVDAQDPVQRSRHLRAGTGLDLAPAMQAQDTRLVSVYFAKHNSPNKGSKEYQNQPPKIWKEAGSVGRFWGYWNLKPAEFAVDISDEQALFISRTLRRWHRANSSPRRVKVLRSILLTGVVKTRHVRRRINRMTQTSGFVTVTDGANMTKVLARALETCL